MPPQRGSSWTVGDQMWVGMKETKLSFVMWYCIHVKCINCFTLILFYILSYLSLSDMKHLLLALLLSAYFSYHLYIFFPSYLPLPLKILIFFFVSSHVQNKKGCNILFSSAKFFNIVVMELSMSICHVIWLKFSFVRFQLFLFFLSFFLKIYPAHLANHRCSWHILAHVLIFPLQFII